MTATEALRQFCLICYNLFPPEEMLEAARSQKLVEMFEQILDDLFLPRDTSLRVEDNPPCRVCVLAVF